MLRLVFLLDSIILSIKQLLSLRRRVGLHMNLMYTSSHFASRARTSLHVGWLLMFWYIGAIMKAANILASSLVPLPTWAPSTLNQESLQSGSSFLWHCLKGEAEWVVWLVPVKKFEGTLERTALWTIIPWVSVLLFTDDFLIPPISGK